MIDKKQYLDILENDPHDFNALRGLLCAEFRWDSFDQVKDLDRLGRTVSEFNVYVPNFFVK